jgi:hypothetical protein
MWSRAEGCHLGIGDDLAFGVGAAIEFAPNAQPRRGAGAGDQVDDHRQTHQRLAARSAASVLKIAEDLRLSGDDPVAAILGYCRSRVDSWVNSFKGEMTLPRLHQLVDEHLSLRHVVVGTDQELDELVREQLERRELIFGALKSEFTNGTEAITIKLRNPVPGMKRNLAVIDGRGERARRVYFGIRHEESHLLAR